MDMLKSNVNIIYNMNYKKHYIKLIRIAQNRILSGYFEKHHIFPQSIFGKNKSIVNLTLKKHSIESILILAKLKNILADYKLKIMDLI